MSDYSYDYKYDTTYCYPEANVLKNKLNIKDADSLLEAERSITALRILELKQSFPDGKLDFSYFKHLHFIFSKTYTGGRARYGLSIFLKAASFACVSL